MDRERPPYAHDGRHAYREKSWQRHQNYAHGYEGTLLINYIKPGS